MRVSVGDRGAVTADTAASQAEAKADRECECVDGGDSGAVFQRVGFSSSASVFPGGMSGAEEGLGSSPCSASAPAAPLCSGSSWDGGVSPFDNRAAGGRPRYPQPAWLLAHRMRVLKSSSTCFRRGRITSP